MHWQTDPLHHRLLYSAGEAFHFLDFIRLIRIFRTAGIEAETVPSQL